MMFWTLYFFLSSGSTLLHLVTCQNIPAAMVGNQPPSFEQVNQTSLNDLWYRYFQNWLHDANDDVNLLAAVGSPFPSDVRAVTGPFGRLGRPAVEFTPNSYIGRWARDLLPVPFFWNFGIKVSLFMQSIYGGVIFSVLEFDHSKSVLGINVLQASTTKQKIEFIYRSEGTNEEERNLVATFIVPRMDRRWSVFSFTVVDQEVTLFYGGCDRVMKAVFKHKRRPLAVRQNSPIFLGNAGWYIEKPALYGAIYDLTVFKDYRDAIPGCHVDGKKSEVAKEETNGKLPETIHSTNATASTTSTSPSTASSTMTATPTTTTTKTTTTTTIPTSSTTSTTTTTKPATTVPTTATSTSTITDHSTTTSSTTTNPTTTTQPTTIPKSELKTTMHSPKTTTESPTMTTKESSTATEQAMTETPTTISTDNKSEPTQITPDINSETDTITTSSTAIKVEETQTESSTQSEVPTEPSTTSTATISTFPSTAPSTNPTTNPTTTTTISTVAKTSSKTATAKTATVSTITKTSSTAETFSSPTTTTGKPTTTAQSTTSSEPTIHITTEKYRTQETEEIEKRKSTSYELPTPTPYTTDPKFTEVLTLYQTTTAKAETLNRETIVTTVITPSIKTRTRTATSDKDIVETAKNEIKKELERINSTLDELTMASTHEPVTSTNTTSKPTTQTTSATSTTTTSKPTTSSTSTTTASKPTTQTTSSTSTKATSKPTTSSTATTTTFKPTTSSISTTITSKPTPSLTATTTTSKPTTSSTSTTVASKPTTSSTSTTTTFKPTSQTNPSTVTVITTTTTDQADFDILKLEKARHELLEELENIDSTLVKIKGGIDKNSSNISTESTGSATTKPNTNYNKSGDGDDDENDKGRFDDSLDEIVNRVVEKMKTSQETMCSCKKDAGADSENIDFESIAQKIFDKKFAQFEKDTQAKLEMIQTKQGDKGDMGLPGLRGVQGKDGTRGEKGEKGVGQKGAKGEGVTMEEVSRTIDDLVEEKLKEVKGEAGARGPPGEQGIRGQKGEVGPVPNELLETKFAKFQIDAAEFLRNMKGERGDRGQIGLTGRRGEKGESGESSISMQGAKGEKGDSVKISQVVREVYALAKEEIKTLKGEPGEPGDQGPRGFPGPIGPKGPTGEKGPRASGRANVILTENDLVTMQDMFDTGSLAYVISTDNLFIKSLAGWINIPTKYSKSATRKYDNNDIEQNNNLAGPTVIKIKTSMEKLLPNEMDKLLIKETLTIPPKGVMAKRPYLMLVALNKPQTGRMGGLATIDKMCHVQAKHAGYHGLKFHAVLSDSFNDISSMVAFRNRKLPVANTRGEQIFARVDDIYRSDNYTAFNPDIPIYSFDQKNVREDTTWPVKKFWHGSHANGQVHSTKKNCQNWRSDQTGYKGTASSITTYTPALNELDVRCDQKLIVLCLQVR